MKKYYIYIITAFLGLGILNAQDFDRDAMPTPGPTPKVNIAKPETFKLPNGLTVMVVENHKLPAVDVSLSGDIPPSYEGNIAGVGSILATQLGNGTTSISKDDFNNRIDFLGATLNFSSSSVYANMLSKYFEEVMGLMTDALLTPVFDAQEIEKAKQMSIESLKASEKNASSITESVYSALTYGKNTARGEISDATKIQNITVADLKKYHKKNFSPENYYLVVIGDVTTKQVKKALAKGLANWKKTENNDFAPLPIVENLGRTEINVVDVPSAVQAVIKLGNVTDLKVKNEDFFAATIANYILGGGSLDSRLNMNLREKNAFTYGAYSSISSNKYGPNFSASTNVRNAVVPGAVKEMLAELKAIPNITAEELENAKARLKGSFIMSLEKAETVANFALRKLINDLPEDFYKNYLKSIEKVTIEDVKAAAQKYILPNNTRILISGKASEFIPELEKLGYPISYFNKEAEPASKPVEKKIAADVTVASIAAKYIDAIGGKTAVEKVNSITMQATMMMQGMEMKVKNIVANGAKSFTDVSMMGQSMNKIVFDGKEGYIDARGQKMPIPEEMKVEILKEQKVIPELDFANKTSVKLVGIENIKGEDAYGIQDGKNLLYYSVATGLKVAKVVLEQSPQGEEIAMPTYYSDYKDIEGIKLPFSIINEAMGQEILSTVNSYELNKATDEDFK